MCRTHDIHRRWPSGVCAALATMVAACLLATSVAAQAVPLLLGDAYRSIGAENPRIAAAHALARAADARVPGATVPSDPQLQIGFMNYGLPGLEPMDPLGMTQLQLMQMVPTAGKLRASGRIAGAQAAAQHERASDAEWELRTAVAMAFYELYEIDGRLAVSRETLRLLQDIRRTAESMYRVGDGRQSDVLRAQVEVARMTEDTIRMSAMRTAVAERLNALLDRSQGTPVGSPVMPSVPETLPALSDLTTEALARRPMLRAGEREVDAAAAQASLARREIWPDLAVGLQYGRRNGAMGTEHMGSLMLGASLPIFARSRQLRMREEAEAMRQMAAAELSAMRADTRGRIAEVHATLARARNLSSLYRHSVIPQAEATVASAHAAYRVGGVDFMTLLDARMTVNDFRQELLALEAEEGQGWAELEMLIGRQLLDPDRAAVAAGGN